MINRLLFAAGRGARIQKLYFKHKDEECNWEITNTITGNGSLLYDYRIYHEDKHLQYGSISTALREMAETGKEPFTLASLMALSALKYECDPYYPFGFKPEPEHLQYFMLFLSEYFADEGL